jgi:hypothetical protein
MASALYIVLQQKVAGVDASSVGGKFLARNLEMLDALASKLNVRALGDLISVNPAETSAFLEGEGVNDEGILMPPEQWFEPDEGTRTVVALLNSLRSTQGVDARLIQDLESCERVFAAAQTAGVSFHFAVDF